MRGFVMGLLQEFFRNVFEEAEVFKPKASSFEQATPAELNRHFQKSNYGDFKLTNAVRPAIDLKVKPQQGYRHDVYVDEETGTRVPVIIASASSEILFPLFLDLVRRLGETVDVVLETSHNHDISGHVDLYREQIDTPVLTSILLTHDGCTGIAVLNPRIPQEVQFDEHKLLIVYGSPLEGFEHLLESYGVHCQSELHFLTEAEHVHSSTDAFQQQFGILQAELGLDQPREE
jgi:hypothetical protein